MSKIFTISPRQGVGYDVPLHLKLGTEFLVLLIGLMSFLSLLSAIGTLTLGHIASNWTTGLETSLTIEIPSANASPENTKKLIDALGSIKGVERAYPVSSSEMQKLLSPWLGDKSDIWTDLPIPQLITVELHSRSSDLIKTISDRAHKIAPDAQVDAHEDWLMDILRLANGLRMTSVMVFCLILFVTFIVIAGAVRSRMAIHHRELELLHIMGASDRYITLQFIRYILSQSLKGSMSGAALGLAILSGFMFLSKNNPGIVPEVSLQGLEWGVFLAVPAVIMLIGVLSAQITSLRVLREMP